MKLLSLGLVLLGVFALGVAGCGGKEGDEGGQRQLGSVTASDHGTKNASDSTTFSVEADNFYFEPTFIRAKPGQALTLKFENESGTLHNISVPGLGIDEDIPAKGDKEVRLTLPQSGVLLFLCKYHTGRGMNGEFLIGDATPQPASSR